MSAPEHPADLPAIDDPMPVDEIDFFDPAINDCPYHAYRTMRDEAPVWFDEKLQAYAVTRHEDVRAVLMDTERFVNSRKRNSRARRMRPEVLELYAGPWLPPPNS